MPVLISPPVCLMMDEMRPSRVYNTPTQKMSGLDISEGIVIVNKGISALVVFSTLIPVV